MKPPKPERLKRRPTARGAVVFGSGIGLFLLATHFSANAVFILAFFSIALVMIAPVVAWSVPANLVLMARPCVPVGAGDQIICQFRFESAPHRSSYVVIETALGQATEPVENPALRILKIESLPRGVHDFGPVEVVAYDSLGLFRTSRNLSTKEAQGLADIVVYPRPDWKNPAKAAAQGSTGMRLAATGDPAGLRPYRQGDAPRDVDWRASARSQDLMVREYEESTDTGACVFDLAAITGEDRTVETALSRLAAGILTAARNGAAPGLQLPGVSLGPDRGPHHIDILLRALAAYGTVKPS